MDGVWGRLIETGKSRERQTCSQQGETVGEGVESGVYWMM